MNENQKLINRYTIQKENIIDYIKTLCFDYMNESPQICELYISLLDNLIISYIKNNKKIHSDQYKTDYFLKIICFSGIRLINKFIDDNLKLYVASKFTLSDYYKDLPVMNQIEIDMLKSINFNMNIKNLALLSPQ